jgi:DNA-binding NtrC family response regulator
LAELPPLDQARRAFEHGYLVHVLTLAAGNVTHAARYARRNRTEFYRLLIVRTNGNIKDVEPIEGSQLFWI